MIQQRWGWRDHEIWQLRRAACRHHEGNRAIQAQENQYQAQEYDHRAASAHLFVLSLYFLIIAHVNFMLELYRILGFWQFASCCKRIERPVIKPGRDLHTSVQYVNFLPTSQCRTALITLLD